MENLIPLINRLQDVFSAVGSTTITLPQLVVVGSQSSGKSSVLEHIVGRDFLPRGSGIVTRRPLILQLNCTRQSTEDDDEDDVDEDEYGATTTIRDEKENSLISPRRRSSANGTSSSSGPRLATAINGVTGQLANPPSEWGEFLHRPGQKYYSFSAIRTEIEAETDRLTGKNKGVSSQPITLRIYSPNVLPLTLVDLPGITKVPVGDQPTDIEQQIRAMCLQYISNPQSVIIAVSPANSDIANSDALKIAREVDPSGMRTLGVITKLDLMDKGTDAMPILCGQVIPLHHGFVGVVNRSQHDINIKKTISHALEAERTFFSTHPVYRSIASRMGTPYLAKKLNHLLVAHIQECLPEMRAKIAATIAETQAELDSYGASAISSKDAGSILLPLINKFCTQFNEALDGRSPEVSLQELYGGARISYVFRELFAVAIDRIRPFDRLTDADIRTAIRNASGHRPSLFIPEVSFELLVKMQIERLLIPSLDCVDLIYHELQRMAMQCEQLVPPLHRFPNLRARLMECSNSLLRDRVEPTKQVIQNLIDCELAYINTSHPDFIGGSAAVASIMESYYNQNAENKRPGSAMSSSSDSRRPSVLDSDTNRSNRNNASATSIHPTTSDSSNSTTASSTLPTATSIVPTSQTSGNSSSQSQQGQRGGLFSMFFGSGTSNPNNSNSSHQQQSNLSNEYKDAFNGTSSRTSGLYSYKPSRALDSMSSVLDSGAVQGSPAQGNFAPNVRTLAASDRELIETSVIKALINSYFNIVKKNVCDLVPKAIMSFLVNVSKSDLQSKLVSSLYKPSMFELLLKEADDVAEKRASCEELLSILQRAMNIINEARNYNALSS